MQPAWPAQPLTCVSMLLSLSQITFLHAQNCSSLARDEAEEFKRWVHQLSLGNTPAALKLSVCSRCSTLKHLLLYTLRFESSDGALGTSHC